MANTRNADWDSIAEHRIGTTGVIHADGIAEARRLRTALANGMRRRGVNVTTAVVGNTVMYTIKKKEGNTSA